MKIASKIAGTVEARGEAITDAFRDDLINENIDPEKRDQAQDVLQRFYNGPSNCCFTWSLMSRIRANSRTD
jgi:hypothetical protein